MDEQARPQAASRQVTESAQQENKLQPDSSEELRTRLSEMEDRYLLALADLDNLRKRYRRGLQQELVAERRRMAGAWLPILDSLELALAQTHTNVDSFLEGIKAAHAQGVQALEQLGFPRKEETGILFDPNLHEVISVIPESSVPAGTVLEVLRAGYGAPDRLLRPASVVISEEPH